MLLTGVVFVVALVTTVALANPLPPPTIEGSGTSDRSTPDSGVIPCALLNPNTISRYQLRGKHPKLSLCLDERIEYLDQVLYHMVRDIDRRFTNQPISEYPMSGNDKRWPAISEAYAVTQAEFEYTILKRYHSPPMEEHLSRVFHVVLRPSFYTLEGEPVEGRAQGGMINVLEAEIARAVLKREIIARVHGDKNLVAELNKVISALVVMWFNSLWDLKDRSTLPIAERRLAYHILRTDCESGNFVFYAIDREPLDQEVEAHIRSEVGKYLTLNMFGTEDRKLLKYLDKSLRDMEIASKHGGPGLGDLYCNDDYAKRQEVFQALSRRHAVGHFDSPSSWPATYDPATGQPGFGKINVLEARISRLGTLKQIARHRSMENRFGENRSGEYIHEIIELMSLLRAWFEASNAGKFCPTEARKAQFAGWWRDEHRKLRKTSPEQLERAGFGPGTLEELKPPPI